MALKRTGKRVLFLAGKRESDKLAMHFRTLAVRAETFQENDRTVEAVISTEQPIPMLDWERMEYVDEVLLTSGIEMPARNQMPFLDSHQRRTVKDQLGSARKLTSDGDVLTGTLHFRKTKDAEEALEGVRDDHLTDVSVGYDILETVYVPNGETQTIGGREFTGPVNVRTKWKPREVSLTPIGADDQAKLRGLDPSAIKFRDRTSTEKEFEMDKQLRALCVARGMDESLSDEDAQKWLVRNADKLAERTTETETQPTAVTAAEISKLVSDGIREGREADRAARTAFDSEIDSLLELAGMPEQRDACRALEDIEAVREYLQAEKAKIVADIGYGGRGATVGTHNPDRLTTDLRSAMMLTATRQAVNGDAAKLERYYPAAERSKDADKFQHATLFDMAQEYVRAKGVETFGLTRDQVAICAMFGSEKAGVTNTRGASIHSTGDFGNITLDAINKSMMIGFGEVPATWRGPMKQGQSATDFKQIHRMQLGAIPNLPDWNDSVRPEMASLADGKESYAVECKSIGIDFGYKLIVNDDMSALTSVPQKLGDSAARTVNAVAWAQVTSNPTLRDSESLFSAVTGLRFRKNLTTGAGAPSVTTLGALKSLMRLMRGENTPEGTESEDILNLTPTYLCVPTALEVTAEQLVNSIYDPASTGAATFNPAQSLQVVVEPLLDANSATAWYLFAAPTRVETVEVTFLAGQETPQVRSVSDEHTLATTYYVLQSVAAKAMDHRGIQKHAGV
jgi:hypothetical protein